MVKELGKVEVIQKDFINNVSHEIKTPITSIQGFSQLLEDDRITNEERKEYLKAYQGASKKNSNYYRRDQSSGSCKIVAGIMTDSVISLG